MRWENERATMALQTEFRVFTKKRLYNGSRLPWEITGWTERGERKELYGGWIIWITLKEVLLFHALSSSYAY